ncbi:MAG: M3 family metallopeptidase [Lachnospiraceae bacterium]
MFAEFEKKAHEMAEQGRSLTAKSLNEMYYELNKEYFGPDMVIDKDIEVEWARIPHFYTPFYVYQYATGFSAAVAIASMIRKEGQPAVDRYMKFLSSGGSDYPIELLKIAGVDMSKPDAIKTGLDVFAGLLDEMEKLLA